MKMKEVKGLETKDLVEKLENTVEKYQQMKLNLLMKSIVFLFLLIHLFWH